MPRSHDACANCKRRKRKCDETRPECRACLRRGVQCEGYAKLLRWNVGIASRGRFRGAAVPDLAAQAAAAAPVPRVPDPQPQPPDNVNRFLGYVSDSSALSRASTASTRSSVSSDPANSPSPSWDGVPYPSSSSGPSSAPRGPPLSQPALPSGRETTEQVFKRFLNQGLTCLYSTTRQSEMQPFHEEMGAKSQAMMLVCAAIQYYLDDRARGLSMTTMEHFDRAVKAFRAELAYQAGILSPATACAGMLLCTMLLLQGLPWTHYLKLIADLHHLPDSIPSLQPSPEHDFATFHVLEVMGLMDISCLVLGRQNPHLGIWRRLRRAQESWSGGKRCGVENISGLPRSLLDILAGIQDDDGSEHIDYVEHSFWTWPGEVGEHLCCHLWDCWRFAGILEVRRRRRLERVTRLSRQQTAAAASSPEGDDDESRGSRAVPSSEVIMCRMMAAMDAVLRGLEAPQNQHLLLLNGLTFPMMVAGLDVPLVAAHPEWKATLDQVRAIFLARDNINLLHVIFELLDAAWATGTAVFDVNAMVKERGLEIAMF